MPGGLERRGVRRRRRRRAARPAPSPRSSTASARGERPRELHVDRHRVADVHGHPHAGARSPDARARGGSCGSRARTSTPPTCSPPPCTEPASGITLPAIGRSQTVARLDRAVERAGTAQALRLAGALRPLLVELVDAGLPGARDRLVASTPPCRSMPAARCSGASAVSGTMVVQFGHDTMPRRHVAQVVGVHLGDHERHVGVHAERGRVVDDARAASAAAAAPTRARAGRRRRSPRGRGRRSSRRARTSQTTSPSANGSARPSERGDA